MKLAATNQKYGTRLLPARSVNTSTSNSKAKRRTSFFSDSNKSTVLKSNMTKKPKEHHQTCLSSKYSNSKITKQSENEENSVQTINSIESGDFSSVAVPTNSKSSSKTENESDEKTDSENVDKTDNESVNKNDDKKINKTDGENVDKNDSESVDKSDSENVDKTDIESVRKTDDIKVNESVGDSVVNNNVDKIDSENVETSVKNTTDEKPYEKSLAKTDNDKFERSVNKSDDKTNFNCLKKPDEKYVEKANIENVKNTCGKSTESISYSQKTTLKRRCEEKSTYPVHKRKRFKRKRLISTSSQDSNDATTDRKSLDKESKLTNDRSSRKIGRDKRKSRRPARKVERVNDDLYTIEKIIAEMQNKIRNLERKSCLDEKKIETFKKALIEQRENDIKLLMDEKENEVRYVVVYYFNRLRS